MKRAFVLVDTSRCWRFINGNINRVGNEAKEDSSKMTSGPLMWPAQVVRPNALKAV